MIIVALSLYFLFSKEGYDVTTVSDSLKILTADTDGNLTVLPNYLNDIQKQINSMRSQVVSATDISTLNTNVNKLVTDVNNIINGTTQLRNMRVTGTLTTDTVAVLGTRATTQAPIQTTQPPTQAPIQTTQPPTQAPIQTTRPPTQAPIQTTRPPTQAPSAYTLLNMPMRALFGTANPVENSVYSPNREYELLLQPSGNVNIYKSSDRSIIWKTNTTASAAQPTIVFAINNGNIILTSTAIIPVMSGIGGLSMQMTYPSTTLWQSSTSGSGGTKLVLRNDGKLVLYDDTLTRAVWSSQPL